ncbi:RimJ/RimL family protein N-acetyltransferase [Bacillus mesophilus]|uniref:GNAT family N-acetyltransferase n=1 Tax=Bacillus mesophilus TaxID=1808955 RepID=A0A6M0QC96_9BACI|nr:GNAT family protein [Bacillus mesophilus]MBM7663245.1 RimJ/RimL family protein N-acetyltransferase [Bacillus mesophilus]NEY73916.1 GNAT family N-acetyltransferase [Bacillus mesophilus]
MNIRPVNEADAPLLLQLSKKLDEETSFMLFEPGERKTTIEQQRESINRILGQENSMMFVVEEQTNLVGFLGAIGGGTLRKIHSAYIVIGILADFHGRGYGSALFKKLFTWAKEKGLHRLELTVMTHNEKGIALYEKMGFQREGIKKASLKINGEWVDEYYYSYIMEDHHV